MDLHIRGEKGQQVIEVFVDAERPVTADLCSLLSREVRALIAAHHAVYGSYRLTVSSPGIDRPLKHAWQYPKHVGRLMAVRVADPAGDRYVSGTLVAADESGVRLRQEAGAEEIAVPFDSIRDARVKAPW